MTIEKKEQLIRFLQEQIAQADFKAKAYVFDEKNKKHPTRNCFIKLQKYVDDFLEGNAAARWLILSGFRGVGKTTLLSQLYFGNANPEINRLYLSVDQVTQMLGVTLEEILLAYEELLGTVFERLDKPTLLFLDEIQYDKKWAITLKTMIFDRSPKIFIVATGSSALSLQSNPDVARRALSETVFPMSFTEYMKIKDGKYEIKGLSNQIRNALFESNSAEDVYNNLKETEQSVRKYWTGIGRLEVDTYMKYGTLPFGIRLQNEGLVYDQIKKILDRVISMDIAELSQFKTEIISRIPEILYAVAAADGLSVTNLAKDLSLNKRTVIDILSALEKSEILVRIYPYGAHASQVRKPSKYLFASPAFRSMYYNFIGSIIAEPSYMGKLLEDTVGFYLTRYFTGKSYSLTYDSSQSGADFIVRKGLQNIILEAGYGKKGFAQIENTRNRVNAKYGIVASMSPLQLNPQKNAVTVPLSYFLLI
ncbi:MAG: AAA family ATPase [Patescibacteria group bacterium]